MADHYLGIGKDRVELVDIENIEDLNARIVRKRRTRPRIGAGKEDDLIDRFREQTFGESVEVIERPAIDSVPSASMDRHIPPRRQSMPAYDHVRFCSTRNRREIWQKPNG